MNRFILSLLLIAIVAIALVTLINSQQSPQATASVVGLQASSDIAGYARAERVRDFKFPDDHGSHPEFQTEWWYYTGNLEASDGRRFGYQLTFFRRATLAPHASAGVAPTANARESDWGTNQIYFAHFALTDVKNNQHTATERFSRGAAGLAGASGNPFRVWIENWNSSALNPVGSRVQLFAEEDGRALNLTLVSQKPPVLHGDRGLSQKSAEPGNASYYVSFTRLDTSGTITVNGETIAVKGLSWMDHEWSTAVLGENAVGWDWFSIQLSDNRELMLFQIRQKDGSIEPLSSGTLVEPDGTTRHLTREQFDIQAQDKWTSAKSRATYPARWTIAVPSADIRLELKPLIADQEMNVSIIYWEGAVEINGQSRGAPVNGKGFVEMTGYAAKQ